MKQAVISDKKNEPTSVAVAKDLGKIAGVSMASRDFVQCRRYIALALKAWQNINPQSIDFAKLLAGAAALASTEGNLTLADQFNLRALKAMSQSAPTGVEMAALLNNLAGIESKRGHYAKAEQFLLRSAELFSSLHEEDAENRPLEANTWSGLANIAGIRGDLESSEEYDRRALALSHDTFTSANILTNLAITATDRRDFGAARKYIDQALTLEQLGPTRTQMTASLGALGDLEFKAGNIKEAEKVYLRALELLEQNSGSMLDQANLNQRMGEVRLAQGDYPSAQRLFTEAANVSSDLTPESVAYAQSLASLGQCMMNVRNWNKSAGFYERAISVLDKQTIHLGGGNIPERRFRDQYADYYFAYAKSLVELGNLTKAFQESERGRAQILDDIVRTQTETLTTIPKAREQNWTHLNSRIPVTAKEVQALLDPQTLLLEYSLGNDDSQLYVFSHADLKVITLPGRNAINNLVRNLYDLSTERNRVTVREHLNQTDSVITKVTQQLSEIVLPTTISFIGKKRIIVVPDGNLNYLPFSTLFLPSTPKPSRIIDALEVINLPSASVLRVFRQPYFSHREAGMLAAVFSDPVFSADDPRVTTKPTTSDTHQRLPRLLASRTEAEMISTTLGKSSVKQYTDFASSRSTVINTDLRQYRIIHFSTHALIDIRKPERSGLALSFVRKDGSQQAGLLNLQDIYSMHLKADLVVLSACDTAVGENSRSEGPIGLTRAFMYAGSSRVLATLWPVNDDATAVFMRLFYQELRNSDFSPATALRKAQLAMLTQPRWSAPSYWGAFILVGDCAPMRFSAGS